METKKKALGKGLEELFSNSSFTIDTLEDTIVKEERNNATEIELSQIRSNPYQPRKVFDEEALNELADSIKVYGVVEPVILKKSVKGKKNDVVITELEASRAIETIVSYNKLREHH